MAANRIARASGGGQPVLLRRTSEGTLGDFGPGVTEGGLARVRVPPPARRDRRPGRRTTLRSPRGARLSGVAMDGGLINQSGKGCDARVLGEPTEVTQQNPFPSDPSLDGAGPHERYLGGGPVWGSADLVVFDAGPHSAQTEVRSPDVFSAHPVGPGPELRDPPLLTQRSYSLSELSVRPPPASPPSAGLKPPSPEDFQSREDFRTAWLNHRKLARSCHDLDSLGQSPGWGQTQPVGSHVTCRLDCNGGAVQLPDTHISVLVPEGHVPPGSTQRVSLRALLDPPLELSGRRCSTISPVVEIRLSSTETAESFITLETRVSVTLKGDGESGGGALVLCVRSGAREGPYVPVPSTYVYEDTVQARLDHLEPCMYVAVVVQATPVSLDRTVWDYVRRQMTLGLYGPKHIHPSFKTVSALFGHDCTPKTLLVNGAGGSAGPPVVLHLWGKHQFFLGPPQDLQVGLYSDRSSYEVRADELGGRIRGFQVELGKVGRLLHTVTSRDPDRMADFTLRVQVRDSLDRVLAQFCVQTPAPPPVSERRLVEGRQRFTRRKEVDRILPSPLALTSRHSRFQDRRVTSLRFSRALKTVARQNKNPYLLEYRKGDALALLSEEKIRLRGQLWTKEWYVGYHQGKVGLVHAKNVVLLGKVKPVCWSGPDLTTAVLLEQILKPCKFLTYIYASLRTLLMENLGSWRGLADALGYGDRPLEFFCRAEPDAEPEKVASVLEKLKEECTCAPPAGRRSFQRELFTALLKMDHQGLVVRLLQDLVLLTAAVELGPRWRALALRLAHVSRDQMDAYEAPHRDKNGLLDPESMWKPAYDFLLTWAAAVGDCCRDVLQELQLGLDRMRSPPPRRWRHLAGVLLLVHSLDLLRSAAFCPQATHPDTAL